MSSDIVSDITFDCSFGTSNHNSSDMPFFRNSASCNESVIDQNIDEKLDHIEFADEIKNFYRKRQTSTQEYYINCWTFFSIDTILDRKKIIRKDNVITIDLAFTYLGMGHIKVAFYHPKHNKILYRNDGGSNGWDRKDNYKNLINFENNTFLTDGISFKEFIDEIGNNKTIHNY